MKKWIYTLCLFFGIVIICVLNYSKKGPDCVGSISSNADEYLTVVAYRFSIDNKEKFARELIAMCQKNSFKTIKFSTDLRGFPTSLHINVYLSERDVDKGKVEMNIKFKPTDYSQGYDIVNNEDKFQLYIDGQLVG